MVQTITIRAAAAVFILSAIMTGAVSCRVMENILNPADLVIAVTNAPDYDVVPPVLDSFWPAEGAVSEKLIGGAVSDTKSGVSNVTLTITSLDRSKTWNTSVTAVFTNSFDLPFGHYYYQISATDNAGNTTNFPERLAFFLTTNKIVAPDASLGMHFGYAVALSAEGNTLVSGAENDAGGKGAIYISRRDGNSWNSTKITAYDGAFNDRFGCSVAISADGSTVVAGAINNGKGAIYIFNHNGSEWTTNKFTPADLVSSAQFGCSVAISADGNTIVSGARYDIPSAGNYGSMYIFKRLSSNWLTNKIVPDDPSGFDFFGNSVSISYDGNTIACGAPYYNNFNGKWYLYKWDGVNWSTNKFTPIVTNAGIQFGHSISISGDSQTIICGAPSDTNGGINSGSVYVFRWNGITWLTNKITAPDQSADDRFGYGLSLSSNGTRFVCGAPYTTDNGIDSGSIYIFSLNNTNWVGLKVNAYDGDINHKLGWGVSISGDGNVIAGGAYGNSGSKGAVYIIK